ncbi:MAG: hypothetical protein JXA42_08280 [Anaerolineales bacterium]|nr:hypothetical protein [Anaerolineales bacterium]
MRARFFVPGLGRFASADTIVPDPGNPQTLNRYSYTIGNPLRFYDPNGHYHKSVHFFKTYTWVYISALQIGIDVYGMDEQQAEIIAADIALGVANGNQWADDPYNIQNVSAFPGTNHWQSHKMAREGMEGFLNQSNLDPFMFGYNLHAVQDYYAHFGQGHIANILDAGFLIWSVDWIMDDRYSVTGEDLEALNPVSLLERLIYSPDWGHLLSTVGYDTDDFDFNDPWDQAMVDESKYYIMQFLLLYYEAEYGIAPIYDLPHNSLAKFPINLN